MKENEAIKAGYLQLRHILKIQHLRQQCIIIA